MKAARRAIGRRHSIGGPARKFGREPVNVTDTTNVSAGGGSLTLMYADGHVVLCGANANGHYWKQFLSGEFDRNARLLVLDAAESGNRAVVQERQLHESTCCRWGT